MHSPPTSSPWPCQRDPDSGWPVDRRVPASAYVFRFTTRQRRLRINMRYLYQLTIATCNYEARIVGGWMYDAETVVQAVRHLA